MLSVVVKVLVKRSTVTVTVCTELLMASGCALVMNRYKGKVKVKVVKSSPCNPRKLVGGKQGYSTTLFLTSTLGGGECSASRPGCFTAWKELCCAFEAG